MGIRRFDELVEDMKYGGKIKSFGDGRATATCPDTGNVNTYRVPKWLGDAVRGRHVENEKKQAGAKARYFTDSYGDCVWAFRGATGSDGQFFWNNGVAVPSSFTIEELIARRNRELTREKASRISRDSVKWAEK